MPQLLATEFTLPRCPHCGVDRPSLRFVFELQPQNFQGQHRHWRLYVCSRCAGIVSAEASAFDQYATSIYPSLREVSEDIPERARTYLSQAVESISAPAGSVMLSASSVDAMLKAKALTSGSLYARIDEAARQNIITEEMAKWAHEVRLDANDQRHSDEQAPLPDLAQAEKCVEFATALAQFMFVLPARVRRGLASARPGVD